MSTVHQFDLAPARDLAREVLKLAAQGIDPLAERKAQRLEGDKAFAAAAERYIRNSKDLKARSPRGRKEAVRPLRRLAKVWGARHLEEISRLDITAQRNVLVADGSPFAAERLVVEVRAFFAWAVEEGLREDSPAAMVKGPFKRGERRSRQRVLVGPELREVWRACGDIGYPFGPFVRLLMLSGVRRSEASDMTWDELSEAEALWTIPAPRTKTKFEDHSVPLSGLALEVLGALPRFDGPYVFTTTDGARPISGFSRYKERLDAAIQVRRRKALEVRGENPKKAKPIAPWRLHDLRRSVSTTLASLGTQPLVIRLVLGHRTESAHPGVDGTYNRFRYLGQVRQALALWAEHLASVVEDGVPGTVVALHRG